MPTLVSLVLGSWAFGFFVLYLVYRFVAAEVQRRLERERRMDLNQEAREREAYQIELREWDRAFAAEVGYWPFRGYDPGHGGLGGTSEFRALAMENQRRGVTGLWAEQRLYMEALTRASMDQNRRRNEESKRLAWEALRLGQMQMFRPGESIDSQRSVLSVSGNFVSGSMRP